MNLYALFTLGYTEEAHAFMGWVERTTAGRAEDLQLMYGVGGERLLPELELADLDGYRGSRPVRVGNAAAGQFQLDVYGYLLDTAWLHPPPRGAPRRRGTARGKAGAPPATSSPPRSWPGSRSTAPSA